MMSSVSRQIVLGSMRQQASFHVDANPSGWCGHRKGFFSKHQVAAILASKAMTNSDKGSCNLLQCITRLVGAAVEDRPESGTPLSLEACRP